MTNILEKIVQDKKESLIEIKKANSLDVLEKKIKTLSNFLDFKQSITKNKNVSLITEIKKASPSAGILVKDFNHINIAKLYKDNGATCYIPKTHLTTKIPNRHANYKHKVLNLKKGDMMIFDSGLWHKGGPPTQKSRWSIFNYYGPWWMKPYYLFDQMLGTRKINKLNPNIKKMLHCYSTPPKNSSVRISTIVTPDGEKY